VAFEFLLLSYVLLMLWLHGLALLPSMAMHLTGNAFVCMAWWQERRGRRKQSIEVEYAR
jgi:hypothetical protein